MKVHVLNGDMLREQLAHTNIEGDIIVIRECLIDGPVHTASGQLPDFWEMRQAYLTLTYESSTNFYREKVAGSFEKLLGLPKGSEVNLWFEHDLFCQANMWFVLHLLKNSSIEPKVYRVAPVIEHEKHLWLGFGGLKPEQLPQCLEQRVLFAKSDLALGAELWEAFAQQNEVKLRQLAQTPSPCFAYLPEVCEAAIAKWQGGVERTIQQFIANGAASFNEVFQQFHKEQGIYGMGDLQVLQVYEKVK